MSDERADIGEVLKGLGIHPLDEGERATWAFVLMKTDGPDGASWSYRTTAIPNREELLGALQVQVAILRKELVGEWGD